MMEDTAVIKNIHISDEVPGTNINGGNRSQWRNYLNPAIFTLIFEGGVNFLRYLKNLGMTGEPNLIVLSSKHHYYCDENDLKSVRILINLRKLNLIKHLDIFLNSLVRILPPDASFIGYFSDNKPANGIRFQFRKLSTVFRRFNNFLGSKTNRMMNKREVTELLEKNGFEVVNMTKINGLTYFKSHTTRKPLRLKAC